MMSSVVTLSLAGLLPLAALAWLLYRLRSQVEIAEVTPEWLDAFSVQRYRPMERLLAEDDFRFLRSLPGYRPEIESRLRRERRAAFRRYLNRLIRDFQRLHAAARHAVAYSETDQSHLVGLLIRQRVEFSFAIIRVEIRLALHAFGLANVKVGSLVSSMDAMSRELRLAASPSAA